MLYIKLLTLLVYCFIVVRMCIQSFVRTSMLIQTHARQICSHDSGATVLRTLPLVQSPRFSILRRGWYLDG
jgi:hypothetical protein